MRFVVAAILSLLASPVLAQERFEPTPLPDGCTGGANAPCPLLDFTRRVFAPAFNGVTLAPVQGQPNLFNARTTDRTLPSFGLIWIEDGPMAPEVAASTFTRALQQPGRACSSEPLGQPTAIGRHFFLRCVGGTQAATHHFMHIVSGRERTTVFVMFASADYSLALRTRGERAAVALAQAALQAQAAARPTYTPPANYAQLRADCVDVSDAPRQIAGCDAVLANPAERDVHGIATSNRGHARERSGDLAGALADYERAITLDPAYRIAKVNRGRVLGALGRLDEALAVLDQVIAAENDGSARLERGTIHARRDDYDRAFQDFDEAIRLLPGDPDPVMARDQTLLQRWWLSGFDHRPPPAATLAEAILSAEAFGGIWSADHSRAMRRESATRVSIEHDAMPENGGPGRFVVEAPSCSQVRYSEIVRESGVERESERRIIDLNRLRGLLSRPGRFFVFAPGTYGERTRWTQRGPVSLPIETSPGDVRDDDAASAEAFTKAVVYLDAIRRFCPGGAAAAPAQVSPPAVAQAPAAPTRPATPAPASPAPNQIRTYRSFETDKPFGFVYPAELVQQQVIGFDLALADAAGTFEAFVAVNPATPNLSAESDARAFGNGLAFLDTERQRFPDARMIASGLVRLQAGPAFVIHWSTGTLRLIEATIYGGGRRYAVSHSVPEAEFERRRDAIGFMLANFSTSSEPGPCCAAPVAIPGPSGPPAAAALQVTTKRGLLRDRPYALSYPSSLRDGPDQNAEVNVEDPADSFSVTLNIEPATHESADAEARDFGDGAAFKELIARNWPSSRLFGSAIIQLPTGPAFIIDMTDGVSRILYVSVYGGGRLYEFRFSMPMAAVERRRETIGFILANFSTSSETRPCCAAPAALPGILGSPAAAATPAAPPPTVARAQPAPVQARDVRTARGLTRDKPFSLVYPSSFQERQDSSDLLVADPVGGTFEVSVDIARAPAGSSLESHVRDFGDGARDLASYRQSFPNWRLLAARLVRLPAGQAFVVEWSDGGSVRLTSATMYQDGREYRIVISGTAGQFARHRETIGFILANFSTSSEARPCCAAAVAIP